MIQCQESVLVVDRQGGGGGVGRFYDEDRRRADSYCTRVFVVGRIKICAEILHKRRCVCFYLVFTYWHKEHYNLANLLPSRTTSSPRRQECQIRNVFLKDLLRIDTIEISFRNWQDLRLHSHRFRSLCSSSRTWMRRCQNSIPSSGFRRLLLDASVWFAPLLRRFPLFLLNASYSRGKCCAKCESFRLRGRIFDSRNRPLILTWEFLAVTSSRIQKRILHYETRGIIKCNRD